MITRHNKRNTFINFFDDLYNNAFYDPDLWEDHRRPTLNSKLATNLTEDEKSYTLTAEIPGVEEKDIHISFKDDFLTIGYERTFKDISVDEKNTCHWQRLKYGKFEKSFCIEGINPEKISATLSKGILTITLEKQEKILPKSKQIEVKSLD
jgi:HSP20 family protein